MLKIPELQAPGQHFLDTREHVLVASLVAFEKPEPIPHMRLLIGEEFSFQAWVELSAAQLPLAGLPIVRKALGISGRKCSSGGSPIGRT